MYDEKVHHMHEAYLKHSIIAFSFKVFIKWYTVLGLKNNELRKQW